MNYNAEKIYDALVGKQLSKTYVNYEGEMIVSCLTTGKVVDVKPYIQTDGTKSELLLDIWLQDGHKKELLMIDVDKAYKLAENKEHLYKSDTMLVFWVIK